VINCRIYPIIPALFLILFASYYSQNYSSIMCACLAVLGHYITLILIFAAMEELASRMEICLAVIMWPIMYILKCVVGAGLAQEVKIHAINLMIHTNYCAAEEV